MDRNGIGRPVRKDLSCNVCACVEEDREGLLHCGTVTLAATYLEAADDASKLFRGDTSTMLNLH